MCGYPCQIIHSFHSDALDKEWGTSFGQTSMENWAYTSCLLLFRRSGVFVTSWTAAGQASLSFTISWSLLRFMS